MLSKAEYLIHLLCSMAIRDAYYANLSKADNLSAEGLLNWSKNEIEKIDTLLSLNYVRNKLLLPALKFAFDRQVINASEYDILRYLVQKDNMTIRSKELSKFGINKSYQKARIMNKLKQVKLIKSIKKSGGGFILLIFIIVLFLWGVIAELDKNGFVADFFK